MNSIWNVEEFFLIYFYFLRDTYSPGPTGAFI